MSSTKAWAYVRRNHLALIALVVAVIGVPTAWAAGRNTVGSAQIKRAAVKSSDIANNAVGSTKVADGSLQSSDFAAGQIPAGPPGADGSARAYGYVSAAGTITNSHGVVGNATKQGTGVYCVTLAPSIDPNSIVVMTSIDYTTSSTSFAGAQKAFADWAKGPGITCPAGTIEFLTMEYRGDPTDNVLGAADLPGDAFAAKDEPFAFMVP